MLQQKERARKISYLKDCNPSDIITLEMISVKDPVRTHTLQLIRYTLRDFKLTNQPESIVIYHTLFSGNSQKPVVHQLSCSIKLKPGKSCESQTVVEKGMNTTFTYTLNSWERRRIPWGDLVIPNITPVTPSGRLSTAMSNFVDNGVLTAVMIGFCVLLVFAVASFVGMFIWQRVAKVTDEVEEDLLGSKYFRDDLSSTI